MVQTAQNAAIRGPQFIRHLARMIDVGVTPAQQSLPQRLSQWLDWTHSIALSTALDSEPAAGVGSVLPSASVEEEECALARAALAKAIKGDGPGARAPAAKPAPAVEGSADAQADYAPFRQRYQTMQRSMQSVAGRLRGRLRDRLAEGTADMVRLAEVDAVMERALSPREHTLLAAVPALLGEHFERLRQAGDSSPADEPASQDPATPSGAWLDVFRRDMQSVLLAELDLRFQPVDGLLAALRTR
ncbi:DUF3348 domain-containing protein [Dyella mobilis]|uniref:DUF3348 domain-containing protein n=1 Tax=Dyella mobilis TaxID=1849582 RepID=A0ABS2KCY1_9GAMM|nr:DUF3348 domain-containing protein [Dyella mobilis]MBM7129024.1 DUF3348 domain-containing protein [Dyella mobilis]GLQ99282.1 hypothetical protein GCM10007863_37020 [Dyella mobilis]